MARTWDHRKSKPLSPKLLSLDYHLDNCLLFLMSPVECIHINVWWRFTQADSKEEFKGISILAGCRTIDLKKPLKGQDKSTKR